MNKVLTSLLCVCLGGCSVYKARFIEGPSPGANWTKQFDAPLPWVCIIPSEKTTSMQNIDFQKFTKAVRFNMSFKPYEEKFKNVRLVLVDFRILPATTPSNDKLILKHECASYSKGYINQPERYQLKMSFFIGSTRPPSKPYLEETITMATSKAPAHEALMLLGNEIIEDLKVSDQRKISVEFD